MTGKNKHAPLAQSTQRHRFVRGAATPVLRLMSLVGGKRLMVYAVKEGSGYKHVQANETELR